MSLPERWADWLDTRGRDWTDRGLDRRLRALRWTGPVTGTLDDRDVVLFSTNDYLGYSAHPRVLEALGRAAGQGPRSAALVAGHTDAHEALRRAAADLMGTEDALLFPSGFAANIGTLAALADDDCVVLSDELNHASIIDGCRLARAAGAEVKVFRHRDVAHVEELLAGERRRAIVVSDAIFSMDGDRAPAAELARACADHGALFIVDEAHAFLIAGDRGAGISEDVDGVHVRIATLSKAAGSIGGLACADAALVHRLVQRARSFVFSTALPLPAVAGALAALETRRTDTTAVRALWRNVALLAERTGAHDVSPVIPVVVGDEGRALAASAELLQRGLHVPAVRPPTVPPGSARLRISLSAAHTHDQIELLSDSLVALGLVVR